jgi:hypothetical protein
LAEADEGKQKPKGEKKLDSFSSALRQWQTFVLAIIIIFAYVVFFAWIISTSPSVKENGNTVLDYRGMTSLTGTFGIIAAAVVGYYFGQRNLEQATNMAVEAKKDADESKVKLKNELDDRVPSLEKGKEIYGEAKKLLDSTVDNVGKIDPANKELVVDSISKDVNAFKTKLDTRIDEVDKKLATKKEQRDMIKNY